MKKRNALLVIFIISSLLLSPVNVFAETNIKNEKPKEIILLDDNTDQISSKLLLRNNDDATISELNSKYKIKNKISSDFVTNNISKDDIAVISQKKALQRSNEISKYISQGGYVFIYGKDLDVPSLEKTLNININPVVNDPKMTGTVNVGGKKDIIVFHNGEYKSSIKIDIADNNNNKINPSDDIFIQTIMQYLNDCSNTLDSSKKISISSSSDPIVASSYDNEEYLYRPNMHGTQLLRGKINVDWILHKKDNDSDPTYDYFYIEDNVEATSYSNNGCHLYGINATHDLVYSSDNLISWGPTSSNNQTSWSISLSAPWGISLSFSSGSEKIDIKTTGSQSDDTVTWQASNSVIVFGDYPMEDTTRIMPVSAWASTGTLASIKLYNTAVFSYGVNDINLDCDLTVTYDY